MAVFEIRNCYDNNLALILQKQIQNYKKNIFGVINEIKLPCTCKL